MFGMDEEFQKWNSPFRWMNTFPVQQDKYWSEIEGELNLYLSFHLYSTVYRMEKAAKDFLKLQRKKKDTTPGLEYGPSKDPNTLTLTSKSLFSRSFPTVPGKKINKEASDKSVSPVYNWLCGSQQKRIRTSNSQRRSIKTTTTRTGTRINKRKSLMIEKSIFNLKSLPQLHHCRSSPASLPPIDSSHPSPSFQTPSSVLPPNHQENSFNDCSPSFFDIYLSLQESLSSIFDKYNSRLQYISPHLIIPKRITSRRAAALFLHWNGLHAHSKCTSRWTACYSIEYRKGGIPTLLLHQPSEWISECTFLLLKSCFYRRVIYFLKCIYTLVNFVWIIENKTTHESNTQPKNIV